MVAVPLGISLSGVLIYLVISKTVIAVDESSGEGSPIAHSLTNFSVELLQEVMQKQPGNAVVSPLGVATLLAMLQQGARGTSKNELTNVLHADSDITRQGFGEITHYLKQISSVVIEFANSVFLNAYFDIEQDFQRVLRESFASDVDIVDFNKPSIAVKVINAWVTEKTHKKINEIVKIEHVDYNTNLLFANAIYFKGKWATPFNERFTEEKPFLIGNGRHINVPMMRSIAYHKAAHSKSLSCKWVELPFENGQFSMLVLLPNEGVTVDNLINILLNNNGLTTILNSKHKRNVNLALPKFNVNTQIQLIPTLKAMGVKYVFSDDKANLRGISKNSLSVSQVLHRATFSIDEKGGSASSASAVVMRMRSLNSLPMNMLELTINRPFLVYIVDNINKMPIFAGRITNPST